MSNVESIWLAQAQRGDHEAFSQLVEAYGRPVYNLCYRMLGDPGDAEDAAQETFLRAFKSLRRYDQSRSFPTWLLAIAAHYCIDQLRKRRMTIVSMEEMPYFEIPDNNPGPEVQTSRGEQEARVQALLDTLPAIDRAAVVMYYWYEYSYREIAETLDLTESAVKSRLHRARRSLAEVWTNQQEAMKLTSERQPHDGIKSPAF